MPHDQEALIDIFQAAQRVTVTHHYDEIDPDVVWDVVQDDIPTLLAMLEPLLH